jgi:hypothetical protein
MQTTDVRYPTSFANLSYSTLYASQQRYRSRIILGHVDFDVERVATFLAIIRRMDLETPIPATEAYITK